MTITKKYLDDTWGWFFDMKDTEAAEAEILAMFSEDPDGFGWTEQDIYEQSRKIFIKYVRLYRQQHPRDSKTPWLD